MLVRQFPYLSPEAMKLRRRDGTRPWQAHPCEADAVKPAADEPSWSPWWKIWSEAEALRREIEAAAGTFRDG